MLKMKNVREPKYRFIYEQIRSKIESGIYDRGQMLPSHDQLMGTYNVSLSTIRQSLNELSKVGMVKIEQGRGTFVQNTVPENVTESNVAAKSMNVGFAVCTTNKESRVNDVLDMQIFQSTRLYLQKQQKNILFSIFDLQSKTDEAAMTEFCRRSESMIILGDVELARLRKVVRLGQRVVIIGHLPNNEENTFFSQIVSDLKANWCMAIQLLLAYGHKNIGLVTRGNEAYEKAFCEVCEELQVNKPVVLQASISHDEYAVARELAEQKDLTGLVVLGDHFSCRLINMLKDIGCSVPDDKSLISLGGVNKDDIAVANLCRINSDFERFGAEAAKAINGNVQIYKTIIGKMELGKTLAWSKNH